MRKEAKGHGMQRYIEGWDGAPGSPVVIVDDVCTSGDSIIKAAEMAELQDIASLRHFALSIAKKAERRRSRAAIRSIHCLPRSNC